MTVSVVIPTYNRASFVVRAIDSVLAQSHSVDEIIVVDDGSTDDTLQSLQPYHKDIQVITQDNLGVSASRNAGIRAAKSSLITFLDSDDIWLRTKIEQQLALHVDNPLLQISHTAEEWIRHGKIIHQKKQHQKPVGDCFLKNLDFCKIAPSTVMIKRIVFDDIGYFDEALEVCEDYDLWLRILKKYPLGLVQDKLTIKYAGHDEQLSLKYHSMDRFRIIALLKHMPNIAVKEMIVKKLTLLHKGAIKHDNKQLIKFCEQVQTNLERF